MVRRHETHRPAPSNGGRDRAVGNSKTSSASHILGLAADRQRRSELYGETPQHISARRLGRQERETLAPQIAALRDAGGSWNSIGPELGITPSQAEYIYAKNRGVSHR